MTDPVYLDHNATSPLRPEAAHAVATASAIVGNPSSVHRFGREARRVVEDARESVAALVGAEPGDVVFTSGGTEANNLALRGAGRERVLVSAVEHVSVLEAAADRDVVTVDAQGVVDLRALETRLAADRRPALVSVMLANNETGVIEPIAEVVAIARRFGALVHCDAVQAAGKRPIRLRELGVDFLTISAHKLGGPQGVGALVIGPQATVASMIRGGGQERGRRGGTESVAAIAGFGAACGLVANDDCAKLSAWRDRLEVRLLAAVPGARVFGAGAPRLGNTSCVSMPGVAAEIQVMALDLAGVAVSAGAACSSGKVKISHVLAAMGASASDAGSAIRISLGWSSRESDIERCSQAWTELHHRVTSRASAA